MRVVAVSCMLVLIGIMCQLRLPGKYRLGSPTASRRDGIVFVLVNRVTLRFHVLGPVLIVTHMTNHFDVEHQGFQAKGVQACVARLSRLGTRCRLGTTS